MKNVKKIKEGTKMLVQTRYQEEPVEAIVESVRLHGYCVKFVKPIKEKNNEINGGFYSIYDVILLI